MVERRAPAQRAQGDLGGEGLVPFVGKARAPAFERGREVGLAGVHMPERVQRHDAGDGRHRRQAPPVAAAGDGPAVGQVEADRVAAQVARGVIARRHRPAPFRLDREHVQHARAGLNPERILQRLHDRTGRAPAVRRLRHGPRADEDEPASADEGPRHRPRLQPAHLVVNRAGRLAPVDETFFLAQAVGVGRLAVVLRRLECAALGQLVEYGQQQRCAEAREVVLDLRAGVIGADWTPGGREHASGIERLDHPHDAHAGLPIAGDHGAMHRGGPPVLREQRRVHVQQAQRRRLQHRGGQDLAVGRHHARIGVPGPELREKRLVLQPVGLKHRHASGERDALDRAVADALAAAAGTVRLRDDARDVMARVEQRLERGHGEIGRAEEDQPQRPAGPYHFPVRLSLRIRRTIRSRWMPRRRSTKTRPSRWSISC